MNKIWHVKGEIEVAFPEEKFQKILQELSLKGKKITQSDINVVFISSIERFLKGELFLEELAEIAGYLHTLLDTKTLHHSRLGDVLYKCSELIFYVRFIPEDGTADNFNWFLTDVLKYYREETAQ